MEEKLDKILEFMKHVEQTLAEQKQEIKEIKAEIKSIRENMVTKEDFQVEKTATDRLAGDLYRVKSEVLLIKEEKKTS